MAFYSHETISELVATYDKWKGREDDLVTTFIVRAYRTERATEFARHGLTRRLSGLLHCIDRTFEVVPPEGDAIPNRDDLMDVTAYVQSFVVNVYGAIDNLARIWCLEADVKQTNGNPVPDGHIGLGPKNTTVRTSLSDECQAYLRSSDDWFEYLENYRHALAHRIPLYIPPKTLGDDEGKEWRRLEIEMSEAIKARNHDKYYELLGAQMSLGTFKPVMTHSYGENAKPVMFHGQMLCDFATVVEIGEKVLAELEGLPK